MWFKYFKESLFHVKDAEYEDRSKTIKKNSRIIRRNKHLNVTRFENVMNVDQSIVKDSYLEWELLKKWKLNVTGINRNTDRTLKNNLRKKLLKMSKGFFASHYD